VSTTRWRNQSKVDPSRTALREATYILRTRFEWDEQRRGAGRKFIDFAKRGEDLFVRVPILPAAPPWWATKPFLRWKKADEAAERTGRPDEIRAWHVVADLPMRCSKGEWVDRTEAMVRAVLPSKTIADFAVHVPSDGTPPHMHLLTAARYAEDDHYGGVAFCLYRRLNERLRATWVDWLGA
jgi:hypothetical protein